MRRTLVPVGWFFELDSDRLLVFSDLVPLAESMPARGDDLNLDFALRDGRNFYGTIVIRFQIQFGELIGMKHASAFVETNVNAGVGNRIPMRIRDLYSQLD